MPSYTLHHGDCLEILPTLAAGSVDAVITDPPYGIGVCNRSDGGVGSIRSGSKFYGRASWDLKSASQTVIDAILSLGVPTVIWGGNFFALPPSPQWLIWDKGQRNFTFADAELAWTNGAKAVRVFTYSRGELTTDGKVHPTQKPVALMRWGIRLMTKPGDTILDPFMGSGSTGVACMMEGRNFVGIELDEGYYQIARKRIADAAAQPRLIQDVTEPAATQVALYAQ